MILRLLGRLMLMGLAVVSLSAALLAPSASLAATSNCNNTDFSLTNGIECAAPKGSRPDLEGKTGIFTQIVNVIILLVGAVSIIMVVIGGLRYVVSGGDPAGTKSAKDTIMYALIGVAVTVGAYAIVNFVVTKFN